MKRATLYICYYTVTEPLVQTQVIPYLVELWRRGIDVTLLTFEPRGLCRQEMARSGELIESSGIRWHHLKYHSRPSLLATLYDVAVGTITSAWLCLHWNIKIIHARSHVPAAIGLILKRVLGLRLIFDMRGLLADEYVDTGHWSKGSAKFHLTKRMESAFLNQADAVVMLSRRIREDLASTLPRLRNQEEVTVIPCCIDAQRFDIQPGAREAYRSERRWADRKVVVYAGKLGGWYLTRELIDFFAAARSIDPKFFLQILTQGDRQTTESLLIARGLSREDFDVRRVSPSELPHILAACDAGVSFIKPSYSKLASSPTKVGEYLGAGLPVITSSGIGDCDDVFRDPRLGIVITRFAEAEYRRAALRLCELLEDASGGDYRRSYAAQELSIQNVGGPRYAAVYGRLLGTTLERSTGSPVRRSIVTGISVLLFLCAATVRMAYVRFKTPELVSSSQALNPDESEYSDLATQIASGQFNYKQKASIPGPSNGPHRTSYCVSHTGLPILLLGAFGLSSLHLSRLAGRSKLLAATTSTPSANGDGLPIGATHIKL